MADSIRQRQIFQHYVTLGLGKLCEKIAQPLEKPYCTDPSSVPPRCEFLDTRSNYRINKINRFMRNNGGDNLRRRTHIICRNGFLADFEQEVRGCPGR